MNCVLCNCPADGILVDLDDIPVCYDCMSWGATEEEIREAAEQKND